MSDKARPSARHVSQESVMQPSMPPLAVKTNTSSSSMPASAQSSPKFATPSGFSTPIYLGIDPRPGEGQPRRQSTSSPRHTHALPMQVGSDMNGYHHSIPHTLHFPHTGSSSTASSRLRASASTLPSPVYANNLPPTPHSIQIAAQAATIAAVAANAAAASSSSQSYYRNGTSMNPSSSSSPSSSSQFPMHSPLLFQQQLQQQMPYERYTAELTNCMIAFLSPILPTEEEYRIKEATRRQLERLAGRVSPGAKLLAFGSMANGFALRNSDMDLCCLIADKSDDDEEKASPSASELVEVLAKLIREETDYTVLPLPKARIPIIKISRASTTETPYEISCDIGFENRLALENTRLLLSYAMVDPPRLRTLVLFLKVWTKRRKINSPYTGTLSSYGYTLMMIYFLSHVKRPVVLPNLQRIPPSASSTRSETVELNGHNIYFYDDVATLRREWSSLNAENVGELLIDFFRHFSKEFTYSREVISIRTESGLKVKDGQVWSSELCIEDPFQSGYNVARTVTRDGLYTIRGEFMRALRKLTARHDRVSQVLAELCEEREDGLTRAPDSHYSQRHRASFAAPSTTLAGMYSPALMNGYPRDVQRRFDLSGVINTGHGVGGSFAFEEMARGLGQAQKSSNMMVYPPTAAMLAPLSQTTGLSPRHHLMRAGLRYETPRRGPKGSFANVNSGDAVCSSARSEDGSSSICDKSKAKQNNGLGSNQSARTSPQLGNALPSFLHPSSAEQSSLDATTSALAYGSEISFGSERFQLHPQPSASHLAGAMGSKKDDARAGRSFSDGVNRSMSLPRPGLDLKTARRSSTPPLMSGPSSPSDLVLAATNGAVTDQTHLLGSNLALLKLGRNGQHASTLSDSSGEKVDGICSSEGAHGRKHASQQSTSSPRLPASPWSLQAPDQDSRDGHTFMTPEEESSFTLDDEPVSISDIGESVSLDATSSQPPEESSTDSIDHSLCHGKEHAVRSWAASQSAGIHGRISTGGLDQAGPAASPKR